MEENPCAAGCSRLMGVVVEKPHMNVTILGKGRFHLFDLARELQARGHLRRLITSYPAFEAVKFGVERRHVKSLVFYEVVDRLWRYVPASIRSAINTQYVFAQSLGKHAARHIPEDTDVLVAGSSFALHAIRRARALGVKVVIVEHGSSHIVYQRDILEEEYRRFGMEVIVTHPRVVDKEIEEYAEADFIAIPSSFVRRSFIEKGVPEEKLLHIPYGVNLDNFYPADRETDTFRVIHCGTLSLRKGVQYLVQAFAELGLKDAELWLVGSLTDEVRPILRKYAAHRNIVHMGPFPQRELVKYYNRCSVFCLASVEEGLAMVIPQAMACGLPVVCTTNTGGEDVVRHGQDGFVIPIRDVQAIKEKLILLYQNRELCREMGRSARERVNAGFSWSDYGERAVAAYRYALNTSRGAGNKRPSTNRPVSAREV